MSSNHIGVTDLPVMWNRPEEDDLLDVRAYLDGLERFILNCPTPISIAIQGDWGTGKTSIMNYLKRKLDGNKKVCTIYFNTWQFSQFDMSDSLYFSFLSAIIAEISGENLHQFCKRLINCMGAFGKGLLGSVSNLDVEHMDRAVEALFASRSKAVQEISELHSEFSKIVSRALEKEKQDRMVIFIDDLDRLPPNVAIELLEVMKLFMDVDKCVFVLAVDYEVVVQGVRQKYGGNMPLSKCRSFFDKIVQLSFRMPVEAYRLDKMIEKYLDGVINPQFHKHLIPFIQVTIGKNPRAFKRMLNSFLLIRSIYESGSMGESLSDEADRAALFCCLCIQASSEEAYTLLLQTDFWNDDHSGVEIFGDDIDTEKLSSRLHKLYPQYKHIESDLLAKVEAILAQLPETAKALYEKEDAGMKRFFTLLQKASITATGNLLSPRRGANIVVNRIVLGDASQEVSSAAEALIQTYTYYLKSTEYPAEELSEKLSALTNDGEKRTSIFRSHTKIDVSGGELWIGTSSGFPVKLKQVQALCKLLKLPPKTVRWYDGDALQFENT